MLLMKILRCVRTAVCVWMMAGGWMAVAAQRGAASAEPVDPGLNIRTIMLWPGGAPGQQGDAPGDVPALTVFAPRRGHAIPTAVIIAPGGAYRGLATDLEGREVADWFSARGITAFVLRYRLGEKYPYPIPLEDAQRAVRWVRANAMEYGIDPQKIGIMGFSAGGHLAAMESVSVETANLDASDIVDRASSKPNFVALGYPWLNAMVPNTNHLITYCSVNPKIAKDKCKEFETKYSPVRFVTRETPPTFIYMTSDDKTVDVNAEAEYFEAMLKAKAPVELHSFVHGTHGSGLGSGDPALDQWPILLDAWLREQGFLTPENR